MCAMYLIIPHTILIYINRSPYLLRGWQNTVVNLLEVVWLNEPYHGPQFTDVCGNKHRGVRFHRIRDFKQHYLSLPPCPAALEFLHEGFDIISTSTHKLTRFVHGDSIGCVRMILPQVHLRKPQ